MKKALQILLILLFLNSCSTKEKNNKSFQPYLTNGTYYLKGKSSCDTLRFNTEKIKRGDWNYKIWKITNDSIFQEDSRGLSSFLGKDRRKYKLNNDTLYIWNKLENKEGRTNKSELESIDKYLLVISNKKELEVIDLNRDKKIDKINDIRSDIQLR